MINEIILMNGYGGYVWSAFIFTLLSFTVLFITIKAQLIKEEKAFKNKFANLNDEKVRSAIKQETYREILADSSISKI